MRIARILLALIVAGVAAYVVLHRRAPQIPSGSPSSAQPTPSATRSSSITARAPQTTISTPPAPAIASAATNIAAASAPAVPPNIPGPLLFGSPEAKSVSLPAETVLENMRTAIRSYGAMFDGNPVGTNPEIATALNGDNPKGVKFLDPEKGMRLNSKGELVDNWGTPFFFHQLSGTETEIRSAGPDKQMWTQDDLVIR